LRVALATRGRRSRQPEGFRDSGLSTGKSAADSGRAGVAAGPSKNRDASAAGPRRRYWNMSGCVAAMWL
ncbi:hypothetical protein U2100_15335, partial [Listeria monocytogenes]